MSSPAGYIPPTEHGILATFVDRREYYLRGRGRVIDLGDSLTAYPSTSPAFGPPQGGGGCTPGGSKGCPMFPRAGTLVYAQNGRLAELDLDPGLGITQNDTNYVYTVAAPLCAGGLCAPAYEDYFAEQGRVAWRRCSNDVDCVERYSTPRIHIPGLDIFEVDGQEVYGPYDCARREVGGESDPTCGAPGGCVCNSDNDLYAHALLTDTAGTFWPPSEDRYYVVIFPGLGEDAVGAACLGMKLRVDCGGGSYADSCTVDVKFRTFRQ